MSFPWSIYLLAILGAALTTLGAMPFWRAFCWKIGLVDDPGHRKIHHTPIALAGGLAVCAGVLVPMLLGMLAVKGSWVELHGAPALEYGLNRRSTQLLALLGGLLGMLLIGLLDDKYELKPAIKFGGQLLIATLVAASGIRITLFVHSLLFSYVVTILWILTVTNAFNILDNMNGLCAGTGAIGAWCLALKAAAQGQYLVAIIGFLFFGALVGFLPYNYPKASSFLGDAGSHVVGYLLAVLAILPHFHTPSFPRAWSVLSPLLILAVPLGDLVWVVILRWRLGKPFYVGDTNHISHRLVRRGYSRSHAVALIWLGATLLGCLAFLW